MNPQKRRVSNGNSGTISKRTKQEPDSDSGSEEYEHDGTEIFPALDISSNDLSGKWGTTVTKVIQGVVSIHFTNITNFDTEVCLTSEATGFVVDATRGIILTNRHVVGPGPFSGYAVFDNHEEAVVLPIYRDPIHDFGFLRFDPLAIKHMTIKELELRPDLAKVGTEIRVVGNDAGEKLSILAGFISRLDRNAPYYGTLTYNDFNTEYIQAAASASGGSSGSPVVNEDGHAVALQAGGSTEASTDFFLPVSRPLRALKCIQEGKPITRGDIQVEWMYKPFEECRRLGLTPEAESRARELFPGKIGLLVADIALPGGPAHGIVKEGDTLISVGGECIPTFVRLDEILDDNVGKELEFVVQRGGQELKHKVTIGNLHDITPNRYVEIAGASFNDLSYQLARCFGIKVKGVYVNNADGAFALSPGEKNGWVLDKINDQATPNLDVFIDVMKKIHDRQKITITYRHLADMHTNNVHVVHMDRHWQREFRLATRNDETGLWDFTSLQETPLPPLPLTAQSAKFIDIPISNPSKAGCAYLSKSFLQVRTMAPIPIDGFPFRRDVGYGVVVDAENGYLLVSRRYVPHDMCDIYVIVAESVDVPAEVVYTHPNLNYAIIKYDPALVKADIRTPKFASEPQNRGDKSFFIGYNYRFRLVTDDVKVSSVAPLNVAANNSSPRYRGTNLECTLLDSKIAQECDTGILVDDDGTVRAFWLTFLGEDTDRGENTYRMALDVTDVKAVIDQLSRNEVPRSNRILDAEFNAITVFMGRTRGVPTDWIDRFEKESADLVKFLLVYRISAPLPGKSKCPLQFADIVLTVNDKLVTSMRDLSPMYTEEVLRFKIVREMQVLDLEVPTIDAKRIETSRAFFWCGSLIQEPHIGVRQLMDSIPSQVYVAKKMSGGPMEQYGIQTGVFITHVDDKETKDLETFISVVKQIPDNSYVKLSLVSYDHVPGAVSIKTNYHYFPMGEMQRDDATEKWREIDHDKK